MAFEAASKVRQWRRNGFVVSTDPALLDLNVVHRFLTESYWAKGIPKKTVQRSIRNSLCFGVYRARKQVGFARVISDFATYAYVGDVFVIDEYRGHGLGKLVMQCIIKHPALQGLRRWGLLTRDAHGLYSKYGFKPLKSPERHMEIHNPDVYKKASSRT
jgi:N-acetylglutamate synthase-like GNAT family acetyltransferase